MRPRLLPVTALLLCFVLIACFGTSTAEASTGGAVGSSGQSGGSYKEPGTDYGFYLTPLIWVIKRDNQDAFRLQDIHASTIYFVDIPEQSSVAYVTTQTYEKPTGRPVPFPNNWYRWIQWMKEGNGDPGSAYNKQLWNNAKLLPSDFINQAKSSGYTNEVKYGALYKKGADYADAIWITKPLVKKSSQTHKHVIVKVSHSNNSSQNFDYNNKSAEWLYNNAPTSRTFSYTSKENEFNFQHNITVTTVRVTRHESWEEDAAGNKHNVKVSYSTGGKITRTGRAHWYSNAGVDRYEMFKPIDLRTGSVASQAVLNQWPEVRPVFRNVPMDISVIVDRGPEERPGDPIRLLDDNNEVRFSIIFNNEQLGIPNKASGGIHVYETKPSRSVAGIGNTVYWDPVLIASATNTSGSIPTVSLKYRYTERKGLETVKLDLYDYYNSARADFEYRAIQAGKYKLGHGVNGGAPFWIIELNTGKYYYYGAKYSTTVTAEGLGPVFSNSRGDTITVQDQNLYVGFVSGKVKQPVLYGEFEVKSVGGYRK